MLARGMMLGDVLAAARKSAGGFEAWLSAADPDFAAALSEAAAREHETVAAFARVAVVEFAEFATDEEWMTLMSNLRDSADPGLECLARMCMRRLAVLETAGDPDACAA